VSLDNVRPPSLAAQTNLTQDFRVYEDTVKVARLQDARQYTYTIRPTRAGTLEVPPIEVAYFDSEERTYRRVTTRPIPLRANAAADMGESMIIAAETNGMSGIATAPEALRHPAPLSVAPRGSVPAPVMGRAWRIPVLAVGPFIWMLLAGARLLQKTHLTRRQGKRRRGALPRALRTLDALNEGPEARTDLCRLLRQYVSERLDIKATGMTPGEIRERLVAELGQPAPVDRLVAILDRNANAVYSREETPRDLAEERQHARQALEKIDKALDAVRGRRS
jgi:hypothetical protein